MHAPITAPSHASILTGLTPLRHGVRDNGAYVLPDTIPSAATLFRRAGYATAAFISGFPLDRRFGFSAGFDHYDDRLPDDRRLGRAAYTERRADDTTARVLAWFEGRPAGPWFVWVHYFDPHAAYEPPLAWRAKFANAYDGEVAFVDDQINRLLERVRREGEPIVAVTADHGESLGEHGEETHGVFIYDATLRVPFLVSGPGVGAGRVSPVLARGIDVLPTLLDLAGLPPPDSLDGRSLRPALEGREMADEPAYIESLVAERNFGWAALRGLRDSWWKYIDAPDPELYDMKADAMETTNRAAAAPDRAAALARLLENQVRVAGTPDAARVQSSGDREASERLRALGYVAASTPAPRPPERRRNPKSGIALFNRLERGLAMVRVDPRRAVTELQAVLAEDPGLAIARRQLAVALSTLGRHDEAVAELERLQAHHPPSAEDLVLLSESYRAAGRAPEAERALRQAAALDPRSPEVPLTEARAFMAARDLDKAATAFSRTLSFSPDHPEALVGLGEIALARGDLAGAGAQFERVLARDPRDLTAAQRLALVRGRQGRMDEAIALLKPVVASMPDNGEALAALGAALARTGRAAEAIPYFERAVAAGQHSPAVLNGLGFARLEAGDRAGALDALRRSLATAPDQPRVQATVRELTSRR
jgi:arylsulfatase A-like enzyme/Flp pilus assembly protein TadD